jgi:hypothetical protein
MAALQWWMKYIYFWVVLFLLQEIGNGQHAGRGRILHYPIPDYSHIPAKVDCWRKNSKHIGEENEVSCAVSHSLVQM